MTKHLDPLRLDLLRPVRAAGAPALAACAGLALAGTSTALAQDPESVTIDVTDCIELTSPEERLRCYEARVGNALDRRPPEPAQPEDDAPARVNAAARPTPEASEAGSTQTKPVTRQVSVRGTNDDFGLRPRDERDGEAPELVATVEAFSERVPNEYVITLDNGQVWRQMVPKRYPLLVGQRVRIYSSGWGDAYRLTAEEVGSFIQVERIR